MKKLIALIVIVFVIWGLVKLLGGSFSLSSKPSSNEDEVEVGFESIEGIVGVPLPKTVTDIEGDQLTNLNTGEGTYWVVAKLPKEDFYNLVKQLELVQKPDLLEFWPEALEREPSPFEDDEFNELWDVKNIVNEDTYFGEKRKEEETTYIVVKYENGKLYFKKSIYKNEHVKSPN